jgi:altered-inheritance-of-mitochondria protein 5
MERSFDETPGPAPASFVGPRPGPPAFSEILKQRWNAALGGAYAHARETDWLAIGGEAVEGVRGQIAKLSAAADETVTEADEARAAAAAAQATAIVDGAASPAAFDAAKNEQGRYVGDVHVDRGVKASERGIKSPKRLV